MAEQPIQGKTIVFVAVVLAAVVGVQIMLNVDEERGTMANSTENALATGNSADELDPNLLEKRVEDNTRMLLSDSAEDRVEASRALADMLADGQTRERVLQMEAELVSGMASALSKCQDDPIAQVRENCRQAWSELHTPAETSSELP